MKKKTLKKMMNQLNKATLYSWQIIPVDMWGEYTEDADYIYGCGTPCGKIKPVKGKRMRYILNRLGGLTNPAYLRGADIAESYKFCDEPKFADGHRYYFDVFDSDVTGCDTYVKRA